MVVESRRVSLKNAQGEMNAMALAYTATGHPATPNGRVFFQCYGDHCFLSEVWAGGRQSGVKLIATRAQIEYAKKASQSPSLTVLAEGTQK